MLAFPTPVLPALLAEGLQLVQQLPAPADASLFSGQLGHAVLFAYAHRLTGETAHEAAMTGALTAVLGQLRNPATALPLLTRPGLLPNLGQVLRVLRQDGLADVDLGPDTLTQFDSLLFKQARAYLRQRNIDFLYGATGALAYLGTRTEANPHVTDYLHELLGELALTKVHDSRGIRFYNSHINYLNSRSDLDLGLAHGHCGLLLVLLGLLQQGVLPAQTEPLATGMLDFLLSLELPPEPALGYVSYFPTRYQEELPLEAPQNRRTYNNRLGWCYGDLNVVQVLYLAHQVLGRPGLLALADKVGAAACARRTLPEAGIESTHLCHGSASLALYYRTLHQARPLACYQAARQFWQAQTLARLPADLAEAATNPRAQGFLMGLPGVLLSLLTDQLDEPVAWPQLLLL
jgi:hypothetical protein